MSLFLQGLSQYKDLDLAKGEEEFILKRVLEKDQRWGLVIVRCSYESQEKWETFISILKQQVIHQLASRDTARLPDISGPDVYENLVTTIIEDQDVLEGADIKTSTNKFIAWLQTSGIDELKTNSELKDIDVQNLDGDDLFVVIPGSPRYEYFIHANQEMIDTFTADLETCGPVEEGDYAFGAVGWGVTYFLYVVYASLVPMEPFSQKQNWHEGYGEMGLKMMRMTMTTR